MPNEQPSPGKASVEPHPRVLASLWDRGKWLPVYLAALLPIAILTVYSYRIAAASVQNLVNYTNISAASNISQLINQEFTRHTGIAHTLAGLADVRAAVQERDATLLTERLSAVIQASSQIDRAFITDVQGTPWVAYPALGSSFEAEPRGDWYEDVSREWRPAVSGVYRGSDKPDLLLVAIAMPIMNAGGKPIGILVFEINATQFDGWLETARVSQDGYLYVLDHTGTVVAHPKLPHYDRAATEYRQATPAMNAILEGEYFTGEYLDPWERKQMAAAFLPLSLGQYRWVIVAQQPVDEAFATLRTLKLNITFVGIALTILTFVMIVALAMSNMHNAHLNRELQKKNQQLLEAAEIVHSSNDAIIGYSLDGAITTWNAAAERIFGYSEKEIIGKPVSMLVPIDRYMEMEDIMEQIMQSKIVRHVDTLRLCKGGRVIDVSLSVSPFKDVNGRIIGASSIARDITERKQIEQMRKDVISIVSHQLKAPVAAIRWMVEAVVDDVFGKVPKKVKQALLDIQDINLRNSHLLADILNVSRIDRGVIKVQPEPVKLKEIVEAAIHDYQAAFKEKKLSLHIKGRGAITVMADKDKCAEAVGNAVSNALKYTKEGSVIIQMREDGHYGYIDVTDTGQGMTAETLEKLFTRDKILGDAATADRSAGLGLYIAKSFMELQRGDIMVQSTLGKGSTFTYKIPLMETKPADAAVPRKKKADGDKPAAKAEKE